MRLSVVALTCFSSFDICLRLLSTECAADLGLHQDFPGGHVEGKVRRAKSKYLGISSGTLQNLGQDLSLLGSLQAPSLWEGELLLSTLRRKKSP